MKSTMFTFESIYIKKIGGLAEVPPRLGEAIERLGVEVELFTPSHSVIDTCKDPIYETKIDGTTYCIKKVSNFKPVHYVVGGGILDDPSVYPPGKLVDKALVFARIIYEFFKGKNSSEVDGLVFHGHDWHSIPALLALNALSVEKKLRNGFILHVHLGSKNKVQLNELCIKTMLCSDTIVKGDLGITELKQYYEVSSGLIERLAALTVDKVITVSMNYIRNLVRLIGLNSAKKTDYVYNASPLTWSQVVEILKEKAGLKELDKPSSRKLYRSKLLTEYIEKIRVSFVEQVVEKYVESLLAKYDVEYNAPFKSDGPLIFMIGRLSSQKGFDYVLKAMDKLLLVNPRVKMVAAFSPTRWDVESVEKWIEAMLSYPDNLRVFPGMLIRDYAVEFYYAANTTLIPSRNEPFGLVALESMAAGTPVAASRVGGLVDIVSDVRATGSKGVGVLFTPGDINDLVESTMYLVELMEAGYMELNEAWLIRNSCIRRAGEFNWDSSARKIINIYKDIVSKI